MDIKLIDLKNKLEKDFGWENLMADNENKWFVDNLLNDAILAINDMQCCKIDSEQLGLERKAYYAGWTHGDLDMGGNFEKWKESKT